MLALLWLVKSLKREVKEDVGAVKDDVRRLERAVTARARSVAFSSVSQTQAAQLLQAAQLTLVNGVEDELVRCRTRRGARARPSAVVSDFVWPKGVLEAAGTPAALEHMRASLQLLGVTFGPGGYSLLDLHTRCNSLSLCLGSLRFKGGMDGAIVPFGVAPLSAANQARVIFELKTRSASNAGLGDSALAQCIAELLGVNAQVAQVAQVALPCILLLTDGTTCDVLRLRGSLVTRWSGVSLADALAYVAEFLVSESSPDLEPQPGRQPRLDDQTAAALNRLAQLAPMPGGGGLAAAAEQLESLLAAEGVDCDTEEGAARLAALATEVAAQWCHSIEPQELPLHVQHMFA